MHQTLSEQSLKCLSKRLPFPIKIDVTGENAKGVLTSIYSHPIQLHPRFEIKTVCAAAQALCKEGHETVRKIDVIPPKGAAWQILFGEVVPFAEVMATQTRAKSHPALPVALRTLEAVSGQRKRDVVASCYLWKALKGCGWSTVPRNALILSDPEASKPVLVYGRDGIGIESPSAAITEIFRCRLRNAHLIP